jgi:hypothetical protein
MKSIVKTLLLCVSFVALQPIVRASSDTPLDSAKSNLQQDIKAAVLDDAITVPQLKELQANVDTLKAAREAHHPGDPVDLLTPYHAMNNIKRVINNVSPKYREKLQADLQGVLAAQAAKAATSVSTPSTGEKLGKDIFKAVMAGSPSDKQVMQLQDSLNSLQSLKTNHVRPLLALRKLRESKSQIAEVMKSDAFRPNDRQAVLDDLTNLGRQS